MAKWKGRPVRGRIQNKLDDAFQPWTMSPLQLPCEIVPKKMCPGCKNVFIPRDVNFCEVCLLKVVKEVAASGR